MKERVRWTVYEDKRVLICDFSGLQGADYAQEMTKTEQFLREEAATNPAVIRQAINVTKATTDKAISKRAKAITAEVKKSTTIHIAMIGITGLTRIIATAVARDIHFAKSPKEATLPS